MNKLRQTTRERLYVKPSANDRYLRRDRPDATVYEIIDNELDEAQLTRIIGQRGKELRFTRGISHDWLA